MTNDKKEKQKLSSAPYKGARDFYPEDMRVQNYIFDTWKKVCKRYGFEQYDFPILEPYEIFASKTGEEIVNEQLFSFEDRGGRKLAIRPELTPGTVRLIAQKYKELQLPIKWFMIGNNWRYEKPQLGRGREFNQLEFNVFGVEDATADFEVFALIIAIMREFGADETMFVLKVSDRRLITLLLNDLLQLDEETQLKVRRLMDKRSKMTLEDFIAALKDAGLQDLQTQKVEEFLNGSIESLTKTFGKEMLTANEGYKAITKLFKLLEDNSLSKYCEFDPSIIRGFDYSDGTVYEVFDKNPTNRRSIFGGERFDRLINIFGDFKLPATGVAMGDYTLLEFLKGWKLLPDLAKNSSELEYFVTVWQGEEPTYLNKSLKLAQQIRNAGKNCFCWLDGNTKLEKQLKYADAKGYKNVVIIGSSELETGQITVKNLQTKEQKTLLETEFLGKL
ncbi:MAG: hypothetical protein ACD_22C00030G0009 [uncultured bacterium]|nr:MAG: hypothetical protein ACD_22C00030G0009 [uncultured bacterium]